MLLGFVGWVGNCYRCGFVRRTETLHVIMSYTNKREQKLNVGKNDSDRTTLVGHCCPCITPTKEVTDVTAL